MMMRHASPPSPASSGLAAFSADDPAEGCVAHLVLAIFACHLGVSNMVDLHMGQALEILETRLNGHQTIRREKRARIVRVVTEANGQVARLLLPIVDEVLVAPCLDIETILPSIRAHRDSDTTATLRDIEIDHVGLRLMPERLSGAMKRMNAAEHPATRAAALTGILDQGLVRSKSPETPLDMADAFFALARDFNRFCQPHLAQKCLTNALGYLETYAGSVDDASHRLVSASMAGKITALVDRLDVPVS